MKLKEFIESFSGNLVSRIESSLNPLYNPLNPTGVDEFENKIPWLLKKPFRVQEEIIKGLSKALYRSGRNRVFLVGEMGTGKTMCALSVIAMASSPQRALIVCPSHLAEKWKRETRETIPDVKIIDLSGKDAISVLDSIRKTKTPPGTHEIYVISKERAKLSYGWRPAAVLTKRSKIPLCPACGSPAMYKDSYLTYEVLERKRYRCQKCSSPLWQADSKLRRYSPAEFIKKYMKNFFNIVVIDEVHDYKAGDSLQGNAMAQLVVSAPKAMFLTGTLNGGYADDLFYLLFRTDTRKIISEGFDYKSVQKWLEKYGTLEYIQKIEEHDSYYGRIKKGGVLIRRRPGVSPVVIGKYLLDKAAFIRLADVIDGLPPYEENVVSVQMDPLQQKEYNTLEESLKEAVRLYKKKALGASLQALLSYPDSCAQFEEGIIIRDRKTSTVLDIVNAPRIEIPLLPKEKELLFLVRKEKLTGRKVLCYLTFTGKRDIRPRLEKILTQARLKVASLDVSVEPRKREAWIEKHKNTDVLLVNAELVKTGLDLYDYPTVVFFQTGYNIFTLRQAARRSWRIGQKQPVRVYFFCYQNTMQEIALSLIARKLETALMVEGELPEGLAEYMGSGSSIIEEMGKALVEGGFYNNAEKAWASFRKKEIEMQLGLNKENIFQQEISRSKPETITSVLENVTVKVTLLNMKNKKQSVIEVKYGDLEKSLDGDSIAQFCLF